MPKWITQRRAAFLKALAETGNLTLAAERARLHRSWVARHRKTNAAFRAASDAAMAEAEVRLAGAAEARGPAGWGHLDGAELVVRGHPTRRAMVMRARSDGWSPALEDRFLGVLAATCNVLAACRAVGLTQACAYYHRRKWSAFDKRWRAALEQGYIALEMGLLECAGNVFSGEEVPADCPVQTVSADQAIHLLWLHRKEVRGVGERPGRKWWLKKEPDIEEVRASILRKVEAVRNAKKLTEAEMARARGTWAVRRPAVEG